MTHPLRVCPGKAAHKCGCWEAVQFGRQHTEAVEQGNDDKQLFGKIEGMRNKRWLKDSNRTGNKLSTLALLVPQPPLKILLSDSENP